MFSGNIPASATPTKKSRGLCEDQDFVVRDSSPPQSKALAPRPGISPVGDRASINPSRARAGFSHGHHLQVSLHRGVLPVGGFSPTDERNDPRGIWAPSLSLREANILDKTVMEGNPCPLS